MLWPRKENGEIKLLGEMTVEEKTFVQTNYAAIIEQDPGLHEALEELRRLRTLFPAAPTRH